MKAIISILDFIVDHPLNKNRRISAIVNFLSWQVASRLVGGKRTVDWVNDAKFITRKGETGLTGNQYCGLMEYEDMAFLLHYLRDTDEFYDIGANVGAYTILASAVRGCKSYTFEPLPDTFGRLVDQIKINKMDKLVDAYNKGVGATKDVLEFTNTLNCMNRVNTDPDNKNVTKVEVTTLDADFSPKSNSLVKIDVEGYESFVVAGGKKFFASPYIAALIVELNGSGEQFGIADTEIDNTIRAFGFSPIRYDPMSRSVLAADKFNSGGNTIYVKDIKAVTSRCSTADKVTVHTVGKIKI
jgi:FkbM family methyltransferase